MKTSLSGAAAGAAFAQPSASPASDQEISDSYIYLLSRLLVLRQQQLDFKEGFKWNQLVHREPGEVVWPNPNLDVAYSEAWVAVDERSCALVMVPKISGRYYTVQFLNGWGETVANLNERLYPQHPHGEFAVCLKGADVNLPATAQRVDVPVKHMRVLSRVELGAKWSEAVALQKQFKVRSTGKPALPAVPKTVMFEMDKLPGAEAFESAEAALDSEADINPGMDKLQASTRAIAKAIKDPAERRHVDQVGARRLPTSSRPCRRWAAAAGATRGAAEDSVSTQRLAGAHARQLTAASGPTSPRSSTGLRDPDGQRLSGDHATLRFTRAVAGAVPTYFWSMIAVDAVERRVLPMR
jgi:hypothetical protein